MRQSLDATGRLWVRGALVGRAGSVFTRSNTQHGGQETTIVTTHMTFLHHGMVIAGLPCTFAGESRIDEITECSPYRASMIAGPEGDSTPTDDKLEGARFQGKYVATIAAKLAVWYVEVG